jgi:subtilisin family serine protease
MPHSSPYIRCAAVCAFLAAIAVLAVRPAPASAFVAHRAHGARFVRVLVKVKHRSSLRPLRGVARALDIRSERPIRALDVRVLRIPRRELAQALRRLRNLHSVEYAERDRVVMRITRADVVQNAPSDPLWGQEWGASLTDAPTAWAVTTGASDVTVAVLDTGVDPSQPDLQGSFVPGYDFVNNDADPSDDFGHGTAVAGIVAARANNGVGLSGFCPACSIMPVKVVGSDGTATEANVATGITWAADHGARVINISLGGSYGATTAAAVAYATSKGVVVVAAAGNNGDSNAFYPAADPGVLSVAATQPNDELYGWSNYGSWISVAAPGCDVTTGRGGYYAEFCGTSAATPVVSGLAALAISFAPTASADAIKGAIISSAHPMTGVSAGRVDVAGTLASLGAVFKPAPKPTVLPSPTKPGAAPAPAAQPAAAAHARRSTPAHSKRLLVRQFVVGHILRSRVHRRSTSRAQRHWQRRWLRLEPSARRS